MQLIHHTTCIRSTGHCLGGYTFEACKHDGSGSSREVEKVVVLSVIGDQRGGSGSRGTRCLDENHGGGSCAHVVVELDGTNVLEGSRGK